MGRYEDSVKLAQIRQLVTEKKYNKASGLLRTIGIKQISSARDLKACALTYSKVGQYQLSRELYEKLYKKERSKLVLQQLVYVCIKLKEFDDATFYYGQFANRSKSKRDNLILYYRIQQAKGVPIEELIGILEELKEEEYLEEWAYELAKLYQKAGRNEDCRKECEEIKTWFGTGEIVERATVLLTYLKVNANLPDYRDKDYTVKEEAPNPLDTGTIPPLDPEILKAEKKAEREKKRRRKEDREAFLIADSEEGFFDDDFMKELEAFNQQEIEKANAIANAEEGADEDKDSESKIDANDKEEARQEEVPVTPSVEEDSSVTKEDKENEGLSDSLEEREEGEILHADSSAGESADDKGAESAETEEESHGEAEKNKEDIKEILKNGEDPLKVGSNGDAGNNDGIKSEEQNLSFPLDKQHEFIRESESGTGITKDLSKEISAIMDTIDEEDTPEETKEDIKNVTAPEGMSEINPNDTGDMSSTSKEDDLDDSFSIFKSDEEDSSDNKSDDMDGEEKGDKKMEDSDMSNINNVMPEPDLPESKQVKPKKRGGLFGFGKKKEKEVKEEVITEEDNKLKEGELPTSKALHRGIGDILTLIRGELEPTNYVLAGTGDERILGISKKIVRIMNQKGFLSSTRIALIKAEQLNDIDLNTAKAQLKGGCLLVSNASKLKFSKTQEIMGVMDEYKGDFCVILSDEGETLDALFKVTPALSSRFQYVIDVTQYGPAEYM